MILKIAIKKLNLIDSEIKGIKNNYSKEKVEKHIKKLT